MALYAWGCNHYGQLGNDSTIPSSTPVLIPGNWKSISSTFVYGNSGSVVGLKCDGTLWAWGYNRWGQLGNNTDIPSSSPVQIPGNWIKAGTNTNNQGFGIRSDCTLWTWGLELFSGIGTTSEGRSSPIQIPGIWTDIYIGYGSTTFGRMLDGTFWGWGRNTCGMLWVNNNNLGAYSPVLMPTNWKWAGAGSAFTIFLHDDGLGRAAGFQQSGRLGNNQTAACGRSNPIMICGGHTWKKICPTFAQTFAFRECDNALFGWGNGPYYNFGVSPSGDKLVPTLIDTGFIDVHVSGMGIRNDGTIWGWGQRCNDETCAGLYSRPVLIFGGYWECFGSGHGKTIFAFGDPPAPPDPPPPPLPKINSRGSWTLWDVHERVIGNEWSNYDPTIDE